MNSEWQLYFDGRDLVIFGPGRLEIVARHYDPTQEEAEYVAWPRESHWPEKGTHPPQDDRCPL